MQTDLTWVKHTTRKMKFLLLVLIAAFAVASASQIECAACEWVVAEADKLISENATVEEINQSACWHDFFFSIRFRCSIINNVCKLVPESVRALCDSLIVCDLPVCNK